MLFTSATNLFMLFQFTFLRIASVSVFGFIFIFFLSCKVDRSGAKKEGFLQPEGRERR